MLNQLKSAAITPTTKGAADFDQIFRASMIASASLWSSQRASVEKRRDPGTHENGHVQGVAHLWRYGSLLDGPFSRLASVRRLLECRFSLRLRSNLVSFAGTPTDCLSSTHIVRVPRGWERFCVKQPSSGGESCRSARARRMGPR